MKKLYALLFCLGLFLVSCEEDDPIVDNTPPEQEVEYTAGSANFSKYVALGKGQLCEKCVTFSA